ncbi:MAG: thiol:disulfide interchange protein DsbG [Gammaproteobacteria bacterium]
MPKYLLLAALTVMLPAFAAAKAAPASTPASSSQPAAVKYLIKKGLEVNSRFSTPGGLTGYIGTVPGGKQTIFFVPKSGSVAVFGTMVDADGHDLSRAYLLRYQRGPGAATGYKNLESRNWIAEGARHPKRTVYAFIDPDCPYCHMLWEKAQGYYDKGVQVRYILVAILGESSLGKAAAILAAKNPSRAFRKNESGFSHHSGAITPLKKVPDKLRDEIAENNALMQHFGFDGTPGMVWKVEDGAVKTQEGLPLKGDLDYIFGVTGASKNSKAHD